MKNDDNLINLLVEDAWEDFVKDRKDLIQEDETFKKGLEQIKKNIIDLF